MTPSVLLYDGHCGLCNGTVRFILQRERLHTLEFAPIGGDFFRGVIARHPELRDMDSVKWGDAPDTPAERVAVRSEAALRVARYLGGAWRLAALGGFVPRRMRDWAYDVVARYRHRLPGVSAQDFVVPAAARTRFRG